MGQREGSLEDVVNPWSRRRVFLTGHTGFKGGWLVFCFPARERPFEVTRLIRRASLIYLPRHRWEACWMMFAASGDFEKLKRAMAEFQPEVVFHLAAQPLVRQSYADPLGTYATNVMGTAHVLEAVRETASVRSVVCATTDKCYENREWIWPYREIDPLGGYDP